MKVKDLWGLAINEPMLEMLTAGGCLADPNDLDEDPRCGCRAKDSRVCWMIKYGEHPDRNPRCSCECHER